MRQDYQSKEVMKAVGFNKGKFDQWLQRGIARPSSPCRGRGHAAKWDVASVIALELTKRLAKIGLALPSAADLAVGILAFYRTIYANNICSGEKSEILFVNCHTFEWCATKDTLYKWAVKGDFVLAFDIADIGVETIARLEEFQ